MTAQVSPELARLFLEVEKRHTTAKDLASNNKPIAFISRDGMRRAMAQLDMSGDAPARLTYLDERGPSGHSCFNSLEDAIFYALNTGLQIQTQGVPPSSSS